MAFHFEKSSSQLIDIFHGKKKHYIILSQLSKEMGTSLLSWNDHPLFLSY